MAKRFTDTEKYKKSFIRSLPAAYKILWDYICLDCNHAGIWHKDFVIAQLYIGDDAPVDEAEALLYFNKDEIKVYPFDKDQKWFIKPFIQFQYGNLNPKNRVHVSILEAVYKNCPQALVDNFKDLISPLQGAKDMDMDMDMDKEELEKPFPANPDPRQDCGWCEGSGKIVRGKQAGKVCWCILNAKKKLAARPLQAKLKNIPRTDCEYCQGIGFIWKDSKNLLCGCWVGPSISRKADSA